MNEELARLLRELTTYNEIQAHLIETQWPQYVEYYRQMGYQGMFRCVFLAVLALTWIIGGFVLLWRLTNDPNRRHDYDDHWLVWGLGCVAAGIVVVGVLSTFGAQLDMIRNPELVVSSDILKTAVMKVTR